MKDSSDNRRYPRVDQMGKIRLNWRDAEGKSYQANAKCLNISRTGLRVTLDRSVPPSTLVNLHSPDFRLAGVAMVRHCKPKGLAFEAGLQFAGGLEWIKKTGEE